MEATTRLKNTIEGKGHKMAMLTKSNQLQTSFYHPSFTESHYRMSFILMKRKMTRFEAYSDNFYFCVSLCVCTEENQV